MDIKTNKKNTRDNLLSVAEGLFAEHGKDGVSIKEITDKAQARLASVNYYFGNKEGLHNEVILRRANTLSSERIKLLEQIDFDTPDIRSLLTDIVRAFVDPLLERRISSDPGWRNYCRLIARVAMRSLSPEIMQDNEFNSTAIRFIESLNRTLSNLSNKQAHYAFQFILSTTLYTFTENGRIDGLSGGKYKSSELEDISNEMIAYMVGGMMEMDARCR